jgi:UDP-N-acetylmuramoyl-tripeptide--D-alanyl-D-alanine ligase
MISLREVLEGTGGTLSGNLAHDFVFQRVIHDSRAVEDGDLFVAIQGEVFDGHDFIPQAVERGAVAALVRKEWADSQSVQRVPYIVVEDPLTSLQQLATWWRGRFDIPLIGITGSIGKTSTKQVVAAMLGERYRVLYSKGNYNNEIGLPLSVLDIGPDTDVVVLEMGGAYAFGEITSLAAIARPSIGIVTNVTHSHVARMGSLEAIARTKTELVEALPEDGLAILNYDDERVRGMAEHARCRVVFYGLDPQADIRATDLESRGADGTSFTLIYKGERNRVQIPLMGLHSVHSALAGLAAGFELGVGLDEMLTGLDRPDVQLRLILTPGMNNSTILDDHYNSNPKSSFAALALLEELEATRKIAVLGDMLELGDFEEEGHRLVGGRVVDIVDMLFTLGPRARIIADEARLHSETLQIASFDDKAELVSALQAVIQPGDLILVKGSRGLKMETVVRDLGIAAGRVDA